MTTIRLALPGLPPSQNKRRHHMQRWRDDQEWKSWSSTLLTDWINKHPEVHLPWDRVHVRYNFHYPRRTNADLDNLIGSMKPCLDGLKGKAFPDDNAQCVHDLSAAVLVIPKVKAGVVIDIERCQCSLSPHFVHS